MVAISGSLSEVYNAVAAGRYYTYVLLTLVSFNSGILSQGRSQYDLALTSLQQALYDPALAFQDRTLAAMRTLSIYEVRCVV